MTEVDAAGRLRAALDATDSSARVQAAMTAGTHPHPTYVPVLVAQCRFEPEFLVREMLTWALTRHDAEQVTDLLLPELGSRGAQVRSQALHTLSKIGGPRVWAAVTTELLTDPEDQVARVAWRTAVRTAPETAKPELARVLATQLARGERETQRSLSEALAALGEHAERVVARAVAAGGPYVRTHAAVTARLLHDPELTFDEAVAAVEAEAEQR
ncbi:HEAT repeat domain-containing protein [Microbacterium dauci]|uniref:HEAT repeat domain-containing protein n=1 Tax=Microbacterium dauci TaxID=3048008 RepID=A0ABT6ZDD7_9MICO|nr:HEAT repeat domain-containing protein [Microbacterium sp. LX3-4]MDJ1114176.1 HEAT repeat domain-containing protein [Microbacterium sp. LX3-4]